MDDEPAFLRLWCDRGQTSAEYIGIIVVVGIVIGVLVSSDLGATLTRLIREAIQSTAGGAGG